MTRINSAINVKNLTDEHLLAEHREIKRLYSYLQKAKSSGSIAKIPKTFCLGTGHVTFFLDKFAFTLKRYKELYNECIKRNFKVEDYSCNWKDIERMYFNDYEPTILEKQQLIERITERIYGSKKENFHYYGKIITSSKAVDILYGN